MQHDIYEIEVKCVIKLATLSTHYVFTTHEWEDTRVILEFHLKSVRRRVCRMRQSLPKPRLPGTMGELLANV